MQSNRRWWWIGAGLMPLLFGLPWLIVTHGRLSKPPLLGLAGLVLVLLTVCCAITDLRDRRIPNWATVTGFAWVVALQILSVLTPVHETITIPFVGVTPCDEVWGVIPLNQAIYGCLTAFGILFLLFALQSAGGGDLKLVVVLGMLSGPSLLLESLIYGGILAALSVFCYIIWNSGPQSAKPTTSPPKTASGEPSPKAGSKRISVPMAPFFGAGSLLAAYFHLSS